MSTTVDSQLLIVRAIGTFSLLEGKQAFLEMLEAVAQRAVRKVLIDGRQLGGKPTTMERYRYAAHAAESVAQYGVPLSTQFAYVLAQPTCDPERFGETVAVNRGMVVRTFESIDDALVWLGIGTAKAADLGGG